MTVAKSVKIMGGGGASMKEILLAIQIEALAEGGFLATCNDLPGLVAQGRTAAEAIEIAQDVARKLIQSYEEHGDELPPALKKAQPPTGNVKIPVSIS
jgi:antitoxin HicB